MAVVDPPPKQPHNALQAEEGVEVLVGETAAVVVVVVVVTFKLGWGRTSINVRLGLKALLDLRLLALAASSSDK